MTREEKENLLREAVDILIKLDNHLMTSRDNAEFSAWVEDLFALEEQEPKWIPVSERLPEADGRYLCTYEDDIEENCVDFGSYENGEWYVDKVIAWMPLPKPYKAESEDKE